MTTMKSKNGLKQEKEYIHLSKKELNYLDEMLKEYNELLIAIGRL